MELLQPHEVKHLLETAIPDSTAQVIDLTGTLDHYKVIVISPAFQGKILLQRHQMINEALKEPLQGPIHALTIEAYTPEQALEKNIQPQGQKPRGITF